VRLACLRDCERALEPDSYNEVFYRTLVVSHRRRRRWQHCCWRLVGLWTGASKSNTIRYVLLLIITQSGSALSTLQPNTEIACRITPTELESYFTIVCCCSSSQVAAVAVLYSSTVC
jgi:hypothetical protein